MPDQSAYIREKLRGAKNAISDHDRPMQERLWSAYLYNLSSMQRDWFPDADAQNEFQAIIEELRKYGEPVEGAGSVPTTLWTMSDADAQALAARIVMFADRCLA